MNGCQVQEKVVEMLSLRRVVFGAICVGIVVAIAAPHAKSGVQERQIAARWVVTWSGLPVLEAKIAADINGGRYSANFNARSRGILELIAKLRTSWQTTGKVDGDAMSPERVRQRYRMKRGGNRVVLMSWSPSGAVSTRIIPPESPGKRKKVPEELQRWTLDPITATLNGLVAPRTGPPCDYAAKVFEGRRRVDFRLSYVSRTRTPSLHVRGVPDQSMVCLLHAQRRAGFHDRHMRQVPKLNPAKIWIVRMPNSGIWLPVQLEFQTRYGMARARLVALNIR